MNLDDHEQQNHCAKTAADAIEESEPCGFHIAAFLPAHGQSNDGLMNEPWVWRANFQNASGA